MVSSHVRLFSLVLLGVALFAFGLFMSSPDSVVSVLDNGLTVTVKEVHSLPLVSIQFWVKTGSRNEPDGFQGIAHVFEHVWFKGTSTQPVGSFHKRVESLGGELNAMTSHDWTMFFVTLPSENFDDIFPFMVDLLVNPLFDDVEVNKELDVIIEEQRSQFNSPERFVDEKFGLALLESHPYRHPIIGYKESILRAPERLREFYNSWYVPSNMNVVVVGDVNAKDIIKKVDDSLGFLQRREVPVLNLPKESAPVVPRLNVTERKLGFSYLALGFLAPSSSDSDRAAVDVLNAVLSKGEASRLVRVLKKEKGLVTQLFGVYAPLVDLGVLEYVLVVDPLKRNEAVSELLVQLNRVKFDVSESELSRAKLLLRADFLKSSEEVGDIGMDLGKAWIEGRPDNYLNLIDAVSISDVKRVASKYIGASSYTLAEVRS